MAESKPGQEPSMEEILSSIRRIIAEDDPAVDQKPAARLARGPLAPSPRAAEEDDVLELTEVVTEPASKAAPEAGPTVPPPAAAAQQPPAPAATVTPPRAPAPSTENTAMPADAAPSLVSPVAATASTQALARIAKVATSDEKKPTSLGGVTVEQMLVDLLTPMLREWLDKNLPEIVERVVEQEVKKLARRAELM
jgi:cell pole-organizing protein PopZ